MEPAVLVFRTNINTFEQMKQLDAVLSRQSAIRKWNVDMEDCDKVLRIETLQLHVENVIGFLKPHDIYCEELV